MSLLDQGYKDDLLIRKLEKEVEFLRKSLRNMAYYAERVDEYVGIYTSHRTDYASEEQIKNFESDRKKLRDAIYQEKSS